MIYPVPKPPPRKKKAPKGLRGPSKRSQKSGGHLFPANVDDPYRTFIRGLPCLLHGARDRHDRLHFCRGGTQACHVKSRGSSGPDRKNLYPGCAKAHNEQGLVGRRAFEHRWQVNLKRVALVLDGIYTRKAWRELRLLPWFEPGPRYVDRHVYFEAEGRVEDERRHP